MGGGAGGVSVEWDGVSVWEDESALGVVVTWPLTPLSGAPWGDGQRYAMDTSPQEKAPPSAHAA